LNPKDGIISGVEVGLVSRFKNIKEVYPYTETALFYDRIMDHVDYSKWALYIHRLIMRHSKGVKSIVDAACGTGSFMKHLERRGYRVSGFDRSLPMIVKARDKTASAFLWQGDLTQFALKPGQELVLCVYDSLQYLTLEQVEAFFKQVFSCLRMRGLLIFDIVTQKHVRENWGNFIERGEFPGGSYIRESWFDKQGQVQHTVFQIFSRCSMKWVCEHHRQYIFNIDDVKTKLQDHGFEVSGLWGDFTFSIGGEQSDRIHFVATKEAV
jgi:SAM-dependent methyltransferase